MSGAPPITWIVIAHGSRATDLVDAHQQVCDAVQARVGDEVSVAAAYLELTEPSIPDAIRQAVAVGATAIVLVPYFLHIGNHTRRDLPEILAAARAEHPGVDLVMADHLGLDSRLVELVVDRASAARATLGGTSS